MKCQRKLFYFKLVNREHPSSSFWSQLRIAVFKTHVFYLHTPVATIRQSLQAHVSGDSSSSATDEDYEGKHKKEKLLLPELDIILKKFSMLEEELRDEEKKTAFLIDGLEQQQNSK